jgi:HPt (histidine-containing phosphotransfer) domain-containing protein
MDDYISKPVRIAELQAVLERWGPTKSRAFDTAFFLRHPPPPSAGLLDEAILAELRDMPPSDGISMLRELIDLFLDGAPARIAQILQCVNDPPKLAFHAHALKSMSLNLGAKKIIDLSQRLEDLGLAGSVQQAPALVGELETTFSQTKAQLLAVRDNEGEKSAPQS